VVLYGRMNYSDDIIILKLRYGNQKDEEQALGQIWKQCYGMVRRLVCSNQGREADAKDIYQEVITNLVQKIRSGEFVRTASLKTYNGSVARNLWLKQLRKNTRNTQLGNLKDTLECTTNIEQNIIRKERYEGLHKQISKLPEREREVLKLYYFERKKMSEIANLLELGSEQVAKNIKCKAMKKLKEYMC